MNIIKLLKTKIKTIGIWDEGHGVDIATQSNTSMKKWYKSKTLWFNILALITIIASSLGYKEFAAESWVNEIGVSIVIIINLILRLFTKQPIK